MVIRLLHPWYESAMSTNGCLFGIEVAISVLEAGSIVMVTVLRSSCVRDSVIQSAQYKGSIAYGIGIAHVLTILYIISLKPLFSLINDDTHLYVPGLLQITLDKVK